MFLRHFCLLISILIFSFSCTNSNKENEIINSMTNSLKEANEILDNNIQEDLSYLKEKTENPLYKDKASSVQVTVDSIVSIINSSEKQLWDASIFYAKNRNDKAFKTKMEIFYNSFTNATEMLWKLDSINIKTIIPNYYSDDNTSKLLLRNKKQFLDNYTKTKDSVLVKGAIATLNFEIKKLKYDLLHFYCKTSMCYYPILFEHFAPQVPIAYINNEIVKPNETLYVNSGVAFFDNPNHQKTFIDGKEVEVNPYNFTITRLKASSKLGKHTVTVRMQIINSDSSLSILEKEMIYYVIK